MGKTPIEIAMDGVDWQSIDQPKPEDGALYATHEGVLSIGGLSLRCYRLNNGQAVFHADDFKAFFGRPYKIKAPAHDRGKETVSDRNYILREVAHEA